MYGATEAYLFEYLKPNLSPQCRSDINQVFVGRTYPSTTLLQEDLANT